MIFKLILFIIIVSLISAQNLFSEKFIVGKGQEFRDIPSAIKRAKANDTIHVMPGHYYVNNLTISKPLVILGKNHPVLDGKFKSDVILIQSDSVEFSGFTIRDVKTSYVEDHAGIKLKNANFCKIINNKLYNTFFGIYLERSKNCLIKNNTIIGNAVQEFSSGNAIHLWYSDNARIEGNHTQKHRDGIYLEFVKNSKITKNRSQSNLRYGLHFMFSDSNLFKNNVFKKNGAGVAVMFSRAVNMYYNKFIENSGSSSYGLLLKEIFDSDISNNIFGDNTSGLYAEGATRCNFRNNTFSKNGWAIRIFGSSTYNEFRQNNFVSNTFDVSTNASVNKNIYMNNYWGKYTGYDLDNDGIGDIPYRPVKLFSYISANSKESLILLRSLFVMIMEFAESITPIFTPSDLNDVQPLMEPAECWK